MPTTPTFLYLASQSPRRAQLLGQLGVRHELLLAADDEDAEALETVLPGESPTAYVQRVTALKLDAAVARLRRRGLADAPVLCADTTVALGRTILGKPEDARDAERMLALLSGTTHRVLTAVALQQGRRRQAALSVSRVRFAPTEPRADPPLRRRRRAAGQGRRLWHPGRGGRLRRAHQRLLFGHHGPPHVRDRATAAARRFPLETTETTENSMQDILIMADYARLPEDRRRGMAVLPRRARP